MQALRVLAQPVRWTEVIKPELAARVIHAASQQSGRSPPATRRRQGVTAEAVGQLTASRIYLVEMRELCEFPAPEAAAGVHVRHPVGVDGRALVPCVISAVAL